MALETTKESSRDGARTLAVEIGTNTLLRALTAAVASRQKPGKQKTFAESFSRLILKKFAPISNNFGHE